MIADYFTKPLQGLIFRQLRDMIMGNTAIALPTIQVSTTADRTSGIPAGSTQQESRSVLENEILPHSLIPVAPVSRAMHAQRHARSLTSETPAQPHNSTVHACTSTVKMTGRAEPAPAPAPANKVLSWAENIRKKVDKCSLF
jgi:hypothetical protein